MATDILFAILRYGVAVCAGIVIGVIFSSGKFKVKGREVKLPYVEKTSRNFTLVVMLMLAISLIAVVNTAVAANRQAQCNVEFRAALSARSQITIEDNKLRDRQAAIQAEDAEALRTFLRALLELSPDAPEGALQPELVTFQTIVNDNANERSMIVDEQGKLDEQRKANPYPEPKCGK